MKITPEKSNVKEWISISDKARHDKEHGKLWGKLYKSIAVPARSRTDVNIYKINKFSKEGETVIVPGKVLGMGSMEHKVSITALEYSDSAKKELQRAGCRMVELSELYDSIKGKKGKINVLI